MPINLDDITVPESWSPSWYSTVDNAGGNSTITLSFPMEDFEVWKTNNLSEDQITILTDWQTLGDRINQDAVDNGNLIISGDTKTWVSSEAKGEANTTLSSDPLHVKAQKIFYQFDLDNS